MADHVPTEAEVMGYFQSLSNWGRWGQDDELGTMNFLSPEKMRQAMSLVTDHVSISLARTISFERTPDTIPTGVPVHFMVESGEGFGSGEKVDPAPVQGATDYFGMVFHGYTVTHMDSLSHIFWQGKMYNGRPAHLVSTRLGATVESIELLSTGIVTRGVLVDVPFIRDIDWVERGEGVMPSDILAAEERCGFKVEEGDILLVRTGQHGRRGVEGPVNPHDVGSTACHVACLPLVHERGVAMLGTDTGNDVIPTGYPAFGNPIHQVGMVAMGLWILDCADLEGLAAECKKRGRWEFMMTILPLRLHNSTGSPINPIAIF